MDKQYVDMQLVASIESIIKLHHNYLVGREDESSSSLIELNEALTISQSLVTRLLDFKQNIPVIEGDYVICDDTPFADAIDTESGLPVYSSEELNLYDKNKPSIDGDPIPTITKNMLNEQQLSALNKIIDWVNTPYNAKNEDENYLILKGKPGTGKTTLLAVVNQELKYKRKLVFTAPTNKATKVLSGALKISAKTTYSALGCRMEHDEDELKLAYGANTYFPANALLVIDEASMLNKNLIKFIDKVRDKFRLKILFVGDPAQLNPINEKRSKIWRKVPKHLHVALSKVERHNNQIKDAADRVRKHIKNKDWTMPIYDDHDDNEGVVVYDSRKQFLDALKLHKKPKDFEQIKVVAWTNKTVDRYNELIRKNFKFDERFCVGDLILIARPIEEDEVIIAHIDDEYEILKVSKGFEKCLEIEVKVWHLLVSDGQRKLSLSIPAFTGEIDDILNPLKSKAFNMKKGARRRALFDKYWKERNKFHSVRYAYALTSHRIQGTTLTECFMDADDILRNSTKSEAFRSLLVATSRPTQWLRSY